MDSEKALFLPHHVKIMKVALALVIIKQKPNGVSARDYTERLALQFNDKQEDWKERATILQRELLRTRQELLKFQITGHDETRGPQLALQQQSDQSCPPHRHYIHPLPPSHSHSTHSHNPQILQMLDHNNLSSQESGYSSSLPHGTQHHGRAGLRCNVNVTISDDEDRRSSTTNIISSSIGAVGSFASDDEGGSTDGCGLTGGGGGTRQEELQKRLKAHVQFCLNASALVHTHRRLSHLMTSDLRVTLRDTLLDACEGLTEAVSSLDSPFPLQLLNEAAKCIVDTIRMPLMSPFKECLAEAGIALVSAMVERTMKQKSATEEFSQAIHSLFHVLCGVPRLFGHTLVTMTTHVLSCAQTMSKTLEDCCLLDPDVVNNTGTLLGVLDSLLQTYEVSAVLKNDVRLKMIEDLEASLMELSEYFPLFSFAVWRVIAQLSLDIPS